MPPARADAPRRYTLDEIGLMLEGLTDTVRGMDSRFDKYVLTAVYEANQAAFGRELGEVKRALDTKADSSVADSARTIAFWALGLIASIVLTGVVALILSAARSH